MFMIKVLPLVAILTFWTSHIYSQHNLSILKLDYVSIKNQDSKIELKNPYQNILPNEEGIFFGLVMGAGFALNSTSGGVFVGEFSLEFFLSQNVALTPKFQFIPSGLELALQIRLVDDSGFWGIGMGYGSLGYSEGAIDFMLDAGIVLIDFSSIAFIQTGTVTVILDDQSVGPFEFQIGSTFGFLVSF